MNERIKELYELALEQVGSDNDALEDLNPQKFAELIIDECAQRADAYAYMSPDFKVLAEELRRLKTYPKSTPQKNSDIPYSPKTFGF